MNGIIELKPLFIKQSELDAQIALNHGVTYEQTKDKRLLALLVELGEFANETRCFKFWSFKKPSSKDIILDEYADGLHFFLSLGIILGFDCFEYESKDKEENFDLTESLLDLYNEVSLLKSKFSKEQFTKAFSLFLQIPFSMGYNGNDIFDAYLKKLEVNHSRQENNY